MQAHIKGSSVRNGAMWLLVLLGFWRPTAAQHITGEVRVAEGGVLPGVNVVVPGLERGAVTDADGRYLLERLPLGAHTVAFRFIGYVTETRTVVVQADTTVTLDITLQPATLQTDEVVITGAGGHTAMLNRATLSVSTLEARDLDALRGQTLGETLEQLPGVTTLSTGPSIAKPVIRGLHSQRLVVLNAGVPQEGQQWGGEHAPEIDPFAPARIEVVKGAAGVEYGVGAIGGAIRVEPRELPTQAGLGGRLMLNGFSNSRQGAGSVLLEGGSRQVPGFGWRVQGTARKAGDAHTRDYVIGNSAFEEFDANIAAGYHTERFGVDAYYSHFGTELGLYRGAHIGNVDDLLRAIERGEPLVDYDFSFTIDPPKQTIAHDLITLRSHYDFATRDRLELQFGYQRNKRQEFDAHRRFGEPDEDPAFALTLTTQTLEAKLRMAPRGHFFGVAGVSGMNQANRNTESGYLIPNFRALTGGTFARGTWISGPWTAEAGARVDWRWLEAFPRENLSRGDFVRRTHNYASFSGVIGGIWRFASAWSVAANLGSAWRPPGVNELYNFGVHHGTAQFETGDPRLGGERSLNADVTLRHATNRATLETSVYNNHIDGFIYLFPTQEEVVTIRGSFPAFQYQQNDVVLRGLDGSASYRLTSWFTAGLRGSVVRATNLDIDTPLIFMPADRATVSGQVAFPDWGRLHLAALEVEGVFIRKQTRVPTGVDYAEPPDGYALLNLSYHAELHLDNLPLTFSLGVQNLLNTRYRDYLSRFRYFIDDPGRNVVLRLQVPFGTVAR